MNRQRVFQNESVTVFVDSNAAHKISKVFRPNMVIAEIVVSDIANQLNHNHLVRTLHASIEPSFETALISTEYARYGEIGDITDISPQQAAFFMMQIASAIKALHSVGIIHGDIKPENILIKSPTEAVLIDFGLSALLPHPGAKVRRCDHDRYTSAYRPYEYTYPGFHDPKADIWALSVTFFAVITGYLLYDPKDDTPKCVRKSIRGIRMPEFEDRRIEKLFRRTLCAPEERADAAETEALLAAIAGVDVVPNLGANLSLDDANMSETLTLNACALMEKLTNVTDMHVAARAAALSARFPRAPLGCMGVALGASPCEAHHLVLHWPILQEAARGVVNALIPILTVDREGYRQVML